MLGLGLPEVVLILLVALGSLAVCAMFVVGIILMVRPRRRPLDAASDGREAS